MAELGAAIGRRKVTSRAYLENVAFDLFGRQGFERTTIDDIASAAGLGRRTWRPPIEGFQWRLRR